MKNYKNSSRSRVFCQGSSRQLLRVFGQSVTILILLLSAVAVFDVSAQWFPKIQGWWVSSGGTAGRNGGNWVYGGEVSFLHIPPKSISAYGFVADCVYDEKLQSCRMMIGPEAAWFFAGIDGGLTLNFLKAKVYPGYSVRPFLALPFFISPVLYYRHSRIFYRNHSVPVNEFGAMMKIAIPLHRI